MHPILAALIAGSFLIPSHIDPDNALLHSEHNAWLNRQWSVGSQERPPIKCCDETDVEVLVDPRWRINQTTGRYEVFFDNQWVSIRPDQVMRPNPADPSPYSEALLFRTGSTIWCFRPATLF